MKNPNHPTSEVTDSENRYKQFINGLPAAFYTCNAEGFIELFNEAAVELWGRVPKLGNDMWCGSWKIFKPDGSTLPLDECPMAIALKEGRSVNVEIVIERPDGNKRNVLPHPKPVYDANGKISGAINTLIDITEQVDARKKVEESEQRLANVISQVSAGIAQADANGKFLEANERFCEITGYSREELITMNVRDLTHPDDIERTSRLMEQALAEDEGFIFEKKYIKKDGREIWVNLNIALLTGTDGGKFFAAVCIDITRVKEQETRIQQLLLNEQNARKAIHELFIQAPAIICVLRGPQHVYELTNKRYMQLIGNRNVVGKPIRQALPELEGTGIFEILDGVYTTGKPFIGNELPVTLERMGGKLEEGFFNFVYQASHNAQGEIDGILVHAIEVTEQVLARKKIEESEKQFSILANNVQNLAWMANADGWIYWYNSRWYEYTGTNREEMEGWGWERVHDSETLPAVLEKWKASIDTGNPFEMVFPLKGADGQFRSFLTRVFPLRDAEGRVIRWVGTNTDIEEQKNQEEELAKAVLNRTNELQQANSTLAEKNAELQRMNKELEAFAYVSSHDLQEPLRKIQTFVTRLLEKEHSNLSETGKHYFSRIQHAAARMQKLIEDLLAYSRASTGERNFEKTDLSQIVEEVKAELKETIDEKHAIIETTEMCHANIIPFQFRQLMNNLIANSLKFSKPQTPPHITIKSHNVKYNTPGHAHIMPGKEYCHINITDNGIGFEEEFSEKIFEVFQRLHGKEKYDGTGIGLAIVKKIVENHHGIITATSELNKGASFDIYLPAT